MHCNTQNLIEASKSKSICVLLLEINLLFGIDLSLFLQVQCGPSKNSELTQSGEAWRLPRIGVRAQLHSIAQECVESSPADECDFQDSPLINLTTIRLYWVHWKLCSLKYYTSKRFIYKIVFNWCVCVLWCVWIVCGFIY